MRLSILILVLLALLVVSATLAHAAPPLEPSTPTGIWKTIRAYQVAYTFDDPPLVRHYGAWFSGSNGTNPHYLGPGRDQATCNSGSGCISTWSWWGANRAVLLLPKCWLFKDFCLSGQIPERWNPSNYKATMWIN
jgi:hypothetical protein